MNELDFGLIVHNPINQSLNVEPEVQHFTNL